MRGLKAVIALLFVIAGIFLGALNQQLIEIDLLFAIYHAPLGLTLIICLLMGCLVGGALASLSIYLKRNIRKLPTNQTQEKPSAEAEAKK